jgi:hypothetical protein
MGDAGCTRAFVSWPFGVFDAARCGGNAADPDRPIRVLRTPRFSGRHLLYFPSRSINAIAAAGARTLPS